MLKIIKSFLRKQARYGAYDNNTAETLLVGDKSHSLIMQEEYSNPEFLQENIKSCVLAYARHKDTAIAVFKDFIKYYEKETGTKINIMFPPVSISSSFERQMFISKYLQDPNHSVNELRDLLWVSERTIAEDIARLRGGNDPIQICGKVFSIPETTAQNGKIHFVSTAHPLFLTPNLTQVLVTLKGLRIMSEQYIYKSYAIKTAQDIWEQLSEYAKNRIIYVLKNILPEDLDWYLNLECNNSHTFYSERECSEKNNIYLECIKNGKSFYVEYDEDDNTVFLTNCVFKEGTYTGHSMVVECDQGVKEVIFEKILRSAYSQEGLL